MNKTPDLFSCFNPQQYLLAVYNYRKATEDSFSYDTWAQELGMQNRSFLRLIVTGKRSLTPKMTAQICRRLGFDDSQVEFFQLLSESTRAKSATSRQFYEKQILRAMKVKRDHHDLQDYQEFVSDIHLPRVHALLSFTDISKTPENFAKILNLSESETLLKLKALEKFGMAKHTADGWEPLNRCFKISDHYTRALQEYHKRCLEIAADAMILPKEERRYRSLLLPLNAGDYESFHAELNHLIDRFLVVYDVKALEDRRLYQIHFSAVPVSSKNESR